jgi:hypothetical protein
LYSFNYPTWLINVLDLPFLNSTWLAIYPYSRKDNCFEVGKNRLYIHAKVKLCNKYTHSHIFAMYVVMMDFLELWVINCWLYLLKWHFILFITLNKVPTLYSWNAFGFYYHLAIYKCSQSNWMMVVNFI